jgi:hypothetical protein
MASNAYMKSLADAAAGVINPAYQAGLDAMVKGQAITPSLAQNALLPGTTVAGVGAQNQAFQQANLTDTINRFYQEQFLPLMIAQQVAGTALGFPGGTTITTQQGGGTSPTQMALGGGSLLASLIPFMMG